MQIGIITLPLHTNYGGILQAYALQTVLERMGHEACLIEKKARPLAIPLWKAPLFYGRRVLTNLKGQPFPIFFEQKMNREKPIVRQHTDRFINKYIKRKIINDFTDIKANDFDAFTVGSDQIWRPLYFNKIEHAYLDFAAGWDVKRIAYAASFGTDEWEYTIEQTECCNKLVKQFDAVSVREDSGVGFCYKHFGVKAQHVLDPTMLLSREDYIHLLEAGCIPKSEGSLFSYILDETAGNSILVNKIAQEKGLTVSSANYNACNWALSLNERIQPSVEYWIKGFYDSEFVITDSFHACIFSILFNKPFIVIGNAGRGMARLKSLLGMFGIEDRLITDGVTDLNMRKINWKNVNSLLEEKRKLSMKFLSDNLNN